MTEAQVEIILQRAREKFPQARPRIISDNGPQFVARDFKEFIRVSGMTHVRTSPYYPQSNGKIERWHGSLKRECIRPGTPLSLEDARRLVERFVTHYNEIRLHSALGFVSPKTKLEGREREIFAARDRKLEAAREARRLRRQAAHEKEGKTVCRILFAMRRWPAHIADIGRNGGRLCWRATVQGTPRSGSSNHERGRGASAGLSGACLPPRPSWDERPALSSKNAS